METDYDIAAEAVVVALAASSFQCDGKKRKIRRPLFK
jgi:hypothetical protein